MKYNDVNDVETEISNNDYVTFDVKPKHSLKGIASRLKMPKLRADGGNLLMLALVVSTAVSLGFLAAQISKFVSLSAATSILSFVL